MKEIILFCLMVIISFGGILRDQRYDSIDENSNEIHLMNSQEANDILVKMERKYASLISYRSKGFAEYPENTVRNDPATLNTTFEVDYEAPSEMKLIWKDSDKETASTFNAQKGKFFLSEGGKTTKKFSSAALAMTSVSLNGHTSLFDVPSILILKDDSPTYSSTSKLSNTQKLDDEVIDDKLCYQVSGEISGKFTEGKVIFTFWIDKESFLIRKVSRLSILGNGESSSNRIERYTDIEFK